MPPEAAATPGSFCTFASSDSGKDGATALPPFPFEIALLPLMTASVFAYTVVNTVLNADLIVSVST